MDSPSKTETLLAFVRSNPGMVKDIRIAYACGQSSVDSDQDPEYLLGHAAGVEQVFLYLADRGADIATGDDSSVDELCTLIGM